MENEIKIAEIDKKIEALQNVIRKLDDDPANEGDSLEEFFAKRKPFDKKIVKLDREKRMLMTPEFSDRIRKDDHVMPLLEFIKNCTSGALIDYDGWGYYVKDGMRADIMIVPSDVKHKSIRPDFDTVVWYNK